MRPAPVFQTDDIYDSFQRDASVDQHPRCECASPKTSWRKKGDQWDCVLCGKKLTREEQARQKFLLREAKRAPKEQEES